MLVQPRSHLIPTHTDIAKHKSFETNERLYKLAAVFFNDGLCYNFNRRSI